MSFRHSGKLPVSTKIKHSNINSCASVPHVFSLCANLSSQVASYNFLFTIKNKMRLTLWQSFSFSSDLMTIDNFMILMLKNIWGQTTVSPTVGKKYRQFLLHISNVSWLQAKSINKYTDRCYSWVCFWECDQSLYEDRIEQLEFSGSVRKQTCSNFRFL